ncbi:MAG: GDP-mannose 4,6-dehydratase [Candidatus Methanomethyliaceae archaeon]
MRSCLVTGVAGFIGSHLAEALLQEGCSVIGIDCFYNNYPRAIKERNLQRLRDSSNFAFYEVDLCSSPLDHLVSQVDVIFHEAALPGVHTSWGFNFYDYCTNNILATQRLLEAAKQRSIRKFVYASSSSVYGFRSPTAFQTNDVPRPASPYGVSKLAAEHLCALYHDNFGVPVVLLRYFSVFGPRQRPDMAFYRFIRSIVRGDPIEVYGDGEQIRDFTYVLDVTTATIQAARVGNTFAIYNIAGGCMATINECIHTIERLLNRRANVVYKARRPGDPQWTHGDITRAREELNFRPTFSLEAGLSAQIEHFLKEASYGSVD